jgi:hypothetical protein
MAPDEKRSGRLVQVRKRCGKFGSDMFILRLRDGSLITWENVMMRRVDDERFLSAFYDLNDMPRPVIPPQQCHPEDSETEVYTINGKYPAAGFVVEVPSQPQTPGVFGIAITKEAEQ